MADKGNNGESKIDKIDKILDLSSKALNLGLKFAIPLLLLFYVVWPLYSFMHSDDESLTIHPFETGGVENLNGKQLSYLLQCELNNIEVLQAEKYPQETSRTYASKSLATPKYYNIYYDNKLNESQFSPGKYNQDPANPSSSFRSDVISTVFSQLGPLSFEGTSIPLGDLILISRQVNGRNLYCSIQRHDSSVFMIAILKDRKAKKFNLWEVNGTLNMSNQLVEEIVPIMIKELAFKLKYDLGKEHPQTLLAFKDMVEERDAYSKYLMTNNSNYLDNASKRALKVLHSEPANSWPYDHLFNIGNEYIKLRMYDKSKAIFQSIGDKRPFEEAMGMGLVESMEENYNESVNSFNRAILLSHDSYRAWYNRGINLRYRAYNLGSEKDILESINSFDNASKSEEKGVSPQMKSYALLEKGKTIEMLDRDRYSKKYDLALDAYSESADKDSTNAEAHFGKGRMYYFIGKKDSNKGSFIESEKAFSDAIDRDPLNAEFHNGKANALFAQGKYNDSLMEYEKAIILDPNLAGAYSGKGNVLLENKEYSEALSAYSTAKEKDPNNELYDLKINETKSLLRLAP